MWIQTFLGLRRFIEWLFRSALAGGVHITYKRIKTIYKTMRFYGLDCLGEPPVPLKGTIGIRLYGQKGHLGFPWLQGYISVLVPDSCRGSRKAYMLPFDRDACLRFSGGSRAMPHATPAARMEAIRQHRDDVTVISVSFNSVVRQVVKRYATWHLNSLRLSTATGLVDPSCINPPVGTSATLNTSCAEGGGLGELMNKIIPSHSTRTPPLIDSNLSYYSPFSEVKWFRPGLGQTWRGPYPLIKERSPSTLLIRDSIVQYIVETVMDLHETRWPSIFKDLGLQNYPSFYLSYFTKVEIDNQSLLSNPDGYDRKRVSCNARIISIEEQGYKSRILTVLPLHIIWTGHVFRNVIKHFISRDPDISIFDTDKIDPFIKNFNRVYQKYPDIRQDISLLYSVDMANATDRIPDDFCTATINGWFDSLEMFEGNNIVLLPHLSSLAWPSITMTYPDRKEFPILQVCGTPMGHPLSWLILSDYHSFLGDMAEILEIESARTEIPVQDYDLEILFQTVLDSYLTLSQTGVPVLKLRRKYPRRLCGDDGVFFCNPEFMVAYRRLHKYFGGSFSKSTDFVSKTRAVFTEKYLTLDKEKGLGWIDCPPVKSFCRPTTRLPEYRDLPPWITAGEAAANGVKWIIHGKQEVLLWITHYNRAVIKQAWLGGLEPYLPQSLGGLGFPYHKTGLKMRGLSKRAIRLLLAPDLNPRHIKSFNSLATILISPTYFSTHDTHIRSMVEYDLDLLMGKRSNEEKPSLASVYLTAEEFLIIVQTNLYLFLDEEKFGLPQTLAHLDFLTLDRLVKLSERCGFIPLKDWVQMQRDYYSSTIVLHSGLELPTREGHTIFRCGREFQSIIRELNNNPHEPSRGPLTRKFLEEAARWKWSMIFIRKLETKSTSDAFGWATPSGVGPGFPALAGNISSYALLDSFPEIPFSRNEIKEIIPVEARIHFVNSRFHEKMKINKT